MTRKALVVAFGLLIAACGASPQAMETKVQRTELAPEQDEQHKKLVTEGDALWEKRDDVESLKAALTKWEEAVKLKDDDWQTYAKLTRGFYFLADGYYQFDAMGGNYPYNADNIADQAANERYLNAHLRGLEHARRGMAAMSPAFEKRMASGTKIEDAVQVIEREGIPLVYWYASNLGKWGKAKGIGTVLKHKESIFALVTHVHETRPDYFHAATDRYFGAFFAVAPAFAGGDLNRSQQHFNTSMKIAPNYLGTYVLAAELYATKTQNQQIFESYLKTVIDAPVDIIKGLEPEAKIEKHKAELLLKNKDELF